MECKFCNKTCKNDNSLRNHQRLCKLNPNKQKTWRQVQNEKGIRLNFYDSIEYKEKQSKIRLSQLPMSQQVREQISKSKIDYYSNEENRKKHSERMKQVVKDNPESYSDNNVVGRSKHFTVEGVRYNSTWEFIVSNFLDVHKIKWKRGNIKPISYWWKEKWHLYFPDFLLTEYDIYVEVKGYETERDQAKWKHVDKPILIIKQKEIDLIKNNSYNIFDMIMEAKSKSGDPLLITK